MQWGFQFWLVAAALAIAVVVFVLILRRQQRAARDAAAEHERQRDALRSEHAQSEADLRAAHAGEQQKLTAARDDAMAAAQQSRDRLRTGMKWEAASADLIADACAAAGVSGVLATNVVFVPAKGRMPQRSFVAQIDHVLLLDSGAAMVIENKSWNGIVFDGMCPSRVHPAFRNLLDESDLTPPFAIQVRSRKVVVPEGDSETWWQVRVAAGESAPGKQALVQATRLSEYVKDRAAVMVWFAACVFYSHPDAVAHVDPKQRITERGWARVVTDSAGLRDLIRERSTGGRMPRTDLDTVVTVLGELGADLRPVGTFTLPAGADAARADSQSSDVGGYRRRMLLRHSPRMLRRSS